MASGAWKDSPLNIKNMGWTKEEEQNMVVDLKSEAIRNLKNLSLKIKRLKIGLSNNSILEKSQRSKPKVSQAYQARKLKNLYRNTTAIIMTPEAKQKRLKLCQQIAKQSLEELFDLMAPKDLEDDDFDDSSPRRSDLEWIKKRVENTKKWAEECIKNPEGEEIAYYKQTINCKKIIKKYDAKSLYF